jgi:outer membrane immunogenic protein
VFAPQVVINGPSGGGFVGGVQAGHNWQVARAVAGLELDLSAGGIKSATGVIPVNGAFYTGTVAYTDKVNYLATARARLGWLPSDTILLYGTAGLAWGRFEHLADGVQTAPLAGTDNERSVFDRFGWVGGAGVEMMLPVAGWTGRIEYLHHDFGVVQETQTARSADPTFTSYAGSAGRHTIDVIRTGLSYKFGAR